MEKYNSILLLICTIFCIRVEGSMRIIGGNDASENQVKYQVHVKTYKEHRKVKCGGSIINERFVISAAHCFINKATNEFFNIQDILITAGTNDLNKSHSEYGRLIRQGKEIDSLTYLRNNDKPYAVLTYVDKIYVPSNVNISQFVGDIAILKLTKPLGVASHPKILTKLNLPDGKTDYLGKTVRISGFGRTVPNEKTLSTKLKYADADVISLEECQKDRHDKIIYPEHHLCTKAHQHDADKPEGICKGDSGGPVVYNGNVLVGIVSFNSRDCNEARHVGVNTRVSSYLKFINGIVRDTSKPDEVRVYDIRTVQQL